MKRSMTVLGWVSCANISEALFGGSPGQRRMPMFTDGDDVGAVSKTEVAAAMSLTKEASRQK